MLAFLRCAGIPDEIVEVLRIDRQQALVRFQSGWETWVALDRLNFRKLISDLEDNHA